jgi:hypothetical protein
MVFSGDRVAQYFASCVVFCRSLSVILTILLSFFYTNELTLGLTFKSSDCHRKKEEVGLGWGREHMY